MPPNDAEGVKVAEAVDQIVHVPRIGEDVLADITKAVGVGGKVEPALFQ